MSGQFLGMHVDQYDDEHVPVSAAKTRDEATSLAIRRVLSLGILSGGIAVVEQPQLSAEEFGTLRDVLDEWFREKGIQ